MALFYIDGGGNFGGAENMVVFDTEDLTADEARSLREAIETGQPESIMAWRFEMNSIEIRIGRKKIDVDGESIKIRTKGLWLKVAESVGI